MRILTNNTKRLVIASCIAAFAAVACSRDDAAAVAPKTDAGAAEAAAGSGPAMWRLADEDSEVYLFGTFHILPASINWTTKAFDDAMAATETTVTEVDTASPEAQAKMAALVQELGLNPPGVTLSSTLGPDRTKKFEDVISKYGVPMASLEPLKPWLAMISLSVMVMQAEGYTADSGAEAIIMTRATSEGDRVAHLESAEYQVRALASLDEAELLRDFDNSLHQLADFEGYSKRVLGAWSSGDVDALDKETLDEMRKSAPGAFKTLITDRNRNWVAEIDRMMQGDGDYFIAVGAGHLVGEGSVVDLLQEKGFEVRRVQ